MGSNVVQIRVPDKILTDIDELVKGGMYRNRNDLINDALRHFVSTLHPSSEIGQFVRTRLRGKKETVDIPLELLDEYWREVRTEGTVYSVFGTSPEEVVETLRRRSSVK